MSQYNTVKTIKHSFLIMIFCKTTIALSNTTLDSAIVLPMFLYINTELVDHYPTEKKIPYTELPRSEIKQTLIALYVLISFELQKLVEVG